MKDKAKIRSISKCTSWSCEMWFLNLALSPFLTETLPWHRIHVTVVGGSKWDNIPGQLSNKDSFNIYQQTCNMIYDIINIPMGFDHKIGLRVLVCILYISIYCLLYTETYKFRRRIATWQMSNLVIVLMHIQQPWHFPDKSYHCPLLNPLIWKPSQKK